MSHKIYAWGKTFSFSVHIGTSHSRCFSYGKRVRLLLEGFCLGQGQVKIFQPDRLTTNSAISLKLSLLSPSLTSRLSFLPRLKEVFFFTQQGEPGTTSKVTEETSRKTCAHWAQKKLKKEVERLVLTGLDNKLISLLTSRR